MPVLELFLCGHQLIDETTLVDVMKYKFLPAAVPYIALARNVAALVQIDVDHVNAAIILSVHASGGAATVYHVIINLML
jgi:hypothetical protein